MEFPQQLSRIERIDWVFLFDINVPDTWKLDWIVYDCWCFFYTSRSYESKWDFYNILWSGLWYGYHLWVYSTVNYLHVRYWAERIWIYWRGRWWWPAKQKGLTNCAAILRFSSGVTPLPDPHCFPHYVAFKNDNSKVAINQSHRCTSFNGISFLSQLIFYHLFIIFSSNRVP